MTQTARAARRNAQVNNKAEGRPLAELNRVLDDPTAFAVAIEAGDRSALAVEYATAKMREDGVDQEQAVQETRWAFQAADVKAMKAGKAEAARADAHPRIRSLNLAPDGAPGAGQPARDRHPLEYSADAVRAVQAAIDTRRGLSVEADLTRERFEVLNATLTTSTHGAPREWAASILRGPRMLHRTAGVRTVPSDAAEAEHSKLALPSSTTAAAEGSNLAEYDSSTAGSVTLGRFGRFTDLSTESMIGTNAEAVIRVHQLGISKDFDLSLIGKVDTDAGSAVAFDSDVPAAIRTQIAVLIDRTGAEDPADIMILAHPDNVALLEDVTPVGGRSIAEPFQQFSGATVYPSAEVATGFMLVANLAAGVLFFEARGTVTEVDSDVKSGVRTVATSIIGGYGTGAIGSYAVKVDVVTP